MKQRIHLDPNGTHEVTLIERDTVTGRDLIVINGEPGKVYEFDLSQNTCVFQVLGRRLGDDDGGGGPASLVPSGVELSGQDLKDADLDDSGEVIRAADADRVGEGASAEEVASPEPVKPPEQDQEPAADAEQTPEEQSDTVDLRDARDDEIKDILVDLAADPATERTQAGVIQVSAINKALEAKGLKPITAARRDELTAAST